MKGLNVFNKVFARGAARASQAKAMVIALVLAFLVTPELAFATGPLASFDDAGVLLLIAAAIVIGITLYGAWIAGLWTLKVLGLMKPKG